MSTDKDKRAALGAALTEWQHWQQIAVQRGWKQPGNSPLPNESWIVYWKAMDRYEREGGGRPVVPHRSAT